MNKRTDTDMRYDKYSQGRRKGLLIISCFTAVVLLITTSFFTKLDDPETILKAILAMLMMLPLWIIFLIVTHKTRKNHRIAKRIYQGDLEKALEDCQYRNSEIAVLDQGIYSYGFSRLMLYGDIAYIMPRYFNTEAKAMCQLWIYEYKKSKADTRKDSRYIAEGLQDKLAVTIDFESRQETEEYIAHIQSCSPIDIIVTAPAGAPDKLDTDEAIRNSLGNAAANVIGLRGMSDEEFTKVTSAVPPERSGKTPELTDDKFTELNIEYYADASAVKPAEKDKLEF